MSLPLQQPKRALTVLVRFLIVVGAVALYALRAFDGPLVLLFTGGLATLLAVPALVLAQLPRPERPAASTPVLSRPRPQDRPPNA